MCSVLGNHKTMTHRYTVNVIHIYRGIIVFTQHRDPATTHPQSAMPHNSGSNFTSQIRTDTEGQLYHGKLWDHPDDINDNQKTPEYVGIVQICCHSEFSCDVLFLLLYS